ncbi:DUF1376 domain-containing protein [Mesorhizobium sp. M2E.F.Ca.ET.209.01.1.1]|uniref:YdaU family protein n=1 Tax=Mesorhizobium sp. M2E.F.Ca.ET.209.01.1.1 TaxID=2500526 RepID=UPI000FDB4EC7|nr:YdaU family protein [Mesorhizobium sp. M2E.F.Ca.ET.209.01.1.1]TGS15908.1 DUF1376 domain-containing protein [Mesorhizobium sp. M2E.F.Ca.ET.209.01.1.1]
MTDLAWMKTYIGDEAAITLHLSAEEFGAYERLRRHYWQHGMLPDDDVRLMRVTGVDVDRWEAVRSAICSLFEDGWRLPRLDNEREAAAEKREIAIDRARKGADARWRRNASSNAPRMLEAMPKAMLEQCPPAPAPAPEDSAPERKEEGLALTRAKEPNVMLMSMAEAQEHLRSTGALSADENEVNGYLAASRGG